MITASVFILQSAGGLGGMTLLLPLFLIAMVLMTVIPNSRKQKKWQQMLSELKAGDIVTTTGGIRGTIFSIREDVLILRVAPDNLKLEFTKSAIASVTTNEEEK